MPGPDKSGKRSELSFGELLDWHLLHGTRPADSKTPSGRSWGNADFSYALGVDERSVRNWRSGRNYPADVSSIERELFGLSPEPASLAYSQREQLREAFRTRDAAGANSRRNASEGQPPPRIAGLVGRDEDLARLHQALEERTVTAITHNPAAISGMGGVGKTTLASEYVHRFGQSYAGCWWCPAETRSSIAASLASLGIHLGAADETVGIERAARLALRDLSDREETWLLVYDNVARPADIVDFVPSGRTRALVTSRYVDWNNWATEVPIDVLQPAAAVSFLLNRTSRSDAEGALALSHALGFLPLALDHAAAICRRTVISFAEFVQQVEVLISAAPPDAPYPRSVFATFSLALEDAARQCPGTEDLMSFISLCGADRIPLALLKGAFDSIEPFRDALAALIDVSLVREDPISIDIPAISAHRLVQSVARQRTIRSKSQARAGKLVLRRLLELYPPDGYSNPKSWPICSALTPHVMQGEYKTLASAADQQSVPLLLNRTASYLQGQATLETAEPVRRLALEMRERLLGSEHIDTAESLNDYALLLYERGKFPEAMELYTRALRIRERVLGTEHSETATTLNNIAVLLQAQGRWSEARPLYERALEIREKTLGQLHPYYGQSLNNLGYILHPLGELDLARPLFEESLRVRTRIFGLRHTETAQTTSNLANLMRDLGHLKEGLRLSFRALAIRRSLLGECHPEVANSFNSLGRLFLATKQQKRARGRFESALQIYSQTLGDAHPNANLSRRLLSVALLECGEVAEGARAALAAFEGHRSVLGPSHPWTRQSAAAAIAALEKAGRRRDAQSVKKWYSPGDLSTLPGPLAQ